MNTQQASLNSRKQILSMGLKNLRLSVNDFSLDNFIVHTLEELMALEQEEALNNLKQNGGYDKKNGTYQRVFKSLSCNAMMIHVPRLRYSNFRPFTLELLKYNQDRINELVLLLNSKGLTHRDISHILKDFFDEKVSPSQISKLALHFHHLRENWEATKLEKKYKVIFCDALYITVKRGNTYSKEAVHIIYGVREDNKRELLSLNVNPTESNQSWGRDFASLKERGVEQVDLVVADGLKGLENSVHQYFPKACFQKCVVHKMRNVLCRVRPKDKEEVAGDLKKVFNNFDSDSSMEKAKIKLKVFIEKWGKMYPYIGRLFSNDMLDYYFTYIKFPPRVRRLIYTTNSIEGLNKIIRKATKNKLSFESPSRLLDYLFVVIKDFQDSCWMRFPVSGYREWEAIDTI